METLVFAGDLEMSREAASGRKERGKRAYNFVEGIGKGSNVGK